MPELSNEERDKSGHARRAISSLSALVYQNGMLALSQIKHHCSRIKKNALEWWEDDQKKLYIFIYHRVGPNVYQSTLYCKVSNKIKRKGSMSETGNQALEFSTNKTKYSSINKDINNRFIEV